MVGAARRFPSAFTLHNCSRWAVGAVVAVVADRAQWTPGSDEMRRSTVAAWEDARSFMLGSAGNDLTGVGNGITESREQPDEEVDESLALRRVCVWGG